MILLKYFFHREYYVNLKNSNIFLLEQPTTLSNVLKMRNNQFLTQLSASNSWNTYVHRDNRYKHARMAPDWWQIARFDHESVKLVSIRQFSASFRMKKKKKTKRNRHLYANEPAKPRNPPENGEKNTDLPLIYIIRHESRRSCIHAILMAFIYVRSCITCEEEARTCLLRVVPRVLRKFERKFTRYLAWHFLNTI